MDSENYITLLKEITGSKLEEQRSIKRAIQDQEDYLYNSKSILHFCLKNGCLEEDALWFSLSGVDFQTLNYLFERAGSNVNEVKRHIEWWKKFKDSNLLKIETIEQHEAMIEKRKIALFCIDNDFSESDTIVFSTSGINYEIFVNLYKKIVDELYEKNKLNELSHSLQIEVENILKNQIISVAKSM